MNPSVIFTHTMMIIGRMPSSLSFFVSTNFNMLKRLLNIRVASQVEWSLVLLLFCSRPVDFCTFCVHCVCVPCADVGMSRESTFHSARAIVTIEIIEQDTRPIRDETRLFEDEEGARKRNKPQCHFVSTL